MMQRRAFVYGYPIKHSLSPAIHNAAFQARGIAAVYAAREVPPAQLGEAVAALRQEWAIGANLTVPHKEAVLGLVDEVDDLARLIGAANTLHNRRGQLRASNTDAAGFSRSLAEAGIAVSGRTALLLGAGGAARAVGYALLGDRVERLVVANRTLERASRLVDAFRQRFPRARLVAVSLDALERQDLPPNTLVVNTTTVGLVDDESPISAEALPGAADVVDIVYTPRPTLLLREAAAAGLRTLDGLPMLVHQAAVAWETWMEQAAPVDVMMAAARAARAERASGGAGR